MAQFLTRTRTQMGVFNDAVNVITARHDYTDGLVCRMTDHILDVDPVDTTNLVVNGDFPTATTGWTASGSALAVIAASLRITNSAGAEGFARNAAIATVVGQQYRVEFITPDVGTSVALTVAVGTTAGGVNLLASTDIHPEDGKAFSVVYTATTTTSFITFGTGSIVTAETAFVDEVEHYAVLTPAQQDGIVLFKSAHFGAPWTKYNGDGSKLIHYVVAAGTACPTNVDVLYPNFNYDPDTMTVRT